MNHASRPRPDSSPATLHRLGDPVVLFSRGEIGRKEAMRLLGDIGYSELLERIADRGLPLPRLPREEAERQSEEIGRLLNRPR